MSCDKTGQVAWEDSDRTPIFAHANAAGARMVRIVAKGEILQFRAFALMWQMLANVASRGDEMAVGEILQKVNIVYYAD